MFNIINEKQTNNVYKNKNKPNTNSSIIFLLKNK